MLYSPPVQSRRGWENRVDGDRYDPPRFMGGYVHEVPSLKKGLINHAFSLK